MFINIFIVIFVISFLISLLFTYFYMRKIYKLAIKKLENTITEERVKAIKQSKAVITGKINEETIPLSVDIPYNLRDLKFSGQPIDYIVYDGMTQLRDTGEGEINIIFADVKTNSASRSKIQNAIKDAILNNRFTFETWQVKQNKLNIK